MDAAGPSKSGLRAFDPEKNEDKRSSHDKKMNKKKIREGNRKNVVFSNWPLSAF